MFEKSKEYVCVCKVEKKEKNISLLFRSKYTLEEKKTDEFAQRDLPNKISNEKERKRKKSSYRIVCNFGSFL
jgi:hypothetical protein